MDIPNEQELRRLAHLNYPSSAGRHGLYEPDGLRTLGKWTSGLIIVGLGLAVVALIALASAVLANADYEALGTDQAAIASSNSDALYEMWALLLLVWTRLGGVVFVIWLYRIYAQAAAVTEYPFTWGRGWAIGSWITPILGLYVPYRLVADIAESVKSAKRGVVGMWWVLFYIGTFVILLASLVLEGAEPSFDTYYALSAFGVLAMIGSGLAAVFLVRRLTGAVADASERAEALARPARHAESSLPGVRRS